MQLTFLCNCHRTKNPRIRRYRTDTGSGFLDTHYSVVRIFPATLGAIPREHNASSLSRSLPWERSGLLANSVCFVSKCVLWCFAVLCGVLRVFCGCFVVFRKCFLKNSVLRCFADVLKLFCNVLDVFCDFFGRHFLSERKMHSTVLRCIAQSVFCSFCAFCIIVGLFCAVLKLFYEKR